MSTTLRFQLGDLEDGDIIQVNLTYVKVIKSFNVYAEASQMRFFYPNTGFDDFASFLTVRGCGHVIAIDGDEITHLGLVNEDQLGVLEGPFKRSEYQLEDKFNEGGGSYLIDCFSPPRGAVNYLNEHYPLASRFMTSQVFCFTAALLDNTETRDVVISFMDTVSEHTPEEELKEFILLMEKMYAQKRIVRQVSEKGFTVMGRAASEESDAVFYTLGLYDSLVGRDLLFTTKEVNPVHIEAFKTAGRSLQENKSIDEVNELIKDKKCRIAVRNIKTFP